MNPPSPPPSPSEFPRAGFAGRALIGLESVALSDDERRRLAHPAIGGAILFARNFRSAAQLRQLAADIRKTVSRPLLIAVDHEGGRVQRFGPPDFTAIPAMREVPSDDAARDCGIVVAAELLAAGLDLSFAPVVDLDAGNSAVVGNRAFSSDPEVVAGRALAFAEGMGAAGMRACAKHFPGHGFASADSHAETPTDPRELAEMQGGDLIPFRKWAEAKMSAVMTAHIIYPESDGAPATFSEFWLRKVLREDVGFGGVVVGDDLAMEGANVGNIGERMEKAVAAGCDAVMVCEPTMVDAALEFVGDISGSESEGESGSEFASPWLRLAARADGRVTIGDLEYEEARGRVEAKWQ